MSNPAFALSLRATIALIIGATLIPLSAAADRPQRMKIREGYVLVKPRTGLPTDKLDEELDKMEGKVERKLRGLKVRLVKVRAGREAQVANALRRNPNIEFAEPDLLVEPDAVVNDPSYPSQWHLPLMGAPSAWTHANGKDVTVAVCDTGVNVGHPDLAGQTIPGWNTASNSADTADVNGHGTKVSGVVAAAANNAVGVASVAPGARIMAMRITDRSDGSAFTSDMAECVMWAADHGARVVNISYSGAASSSSVANAGSYLMNKGGLLVVAAANDGKELTVANSPYILVAAATTSADARASYSNYGDFVDIAAPGSGIYTTTSTGGYASVSGTSFASPNTAATIALVMSANPELTPTDITSIITNTARDLGDGGWDKYYGFGRVDAAAAVEMAAGVATSDRTAPTVAVANPGDGADVKEIVMVDVEANDDFGVTGVDLLVNGTVVASETQEDPAQPYVYRFAWDSTKFTDGTHRLAARARDAAGNVASAHEVAVKVANADATPPELVAMRPGSLTTIAGSTKVGAWFNDDVEIDSIVVSTSSGFQCSTRTADSTPGVLCDWNVKGLKDGTYKLTATATDTAGNQTVRTRRVYVKN